MDGLTTPEPTMQRSASASAKYDPIEERSHQVTRYVTWARYRNRNSKLRATCLLGGLTSAACVLHDPRTLSGFSCAHRRLIAGALLQKASLMDGQRTSKLWFTKNVPVFERVHRHHAIAKKWMVFDLNLSIWISCTDADGELPFR